MSSKNKSGAVKWILTLVVLGGAVAGGVWYYQHPSDAAPEYRTEVVGRSNVVQAVTATGQLTPVVNVQVGSQVSGIINTINVDYNSHVKSNQVIAQIDPATFMANLTQSEGDLMNSQAGLELATINYNRAKALRASELIAQTELDNALASLHQAEAMVKIRQATVQKSKVDLERTTIYAPIDGVVISRAVDVGQTVAASFSTPTLFQIANDLTKMEINAMVSEADVGGVEVNQKVMFLVDAFPGRQFEGLIRQVRYAPVTNQNVVSYVAVVSVDNSDLKLRPGMTATVSIVTAEKENALRIPNAALRFQPAANTKSKSAIGPARANAAAGSNLLASAKNGAPVATATNAPPPGDGEAQPNREEMRRRFENMTPEQREEARARRAAGGGGPGRGGPGGGSRSRSDLSIRTIYILGSTNSTGGTEKPTALPVTVKLGITDGSYTEVLSGLKEGDVIIKGLSIPETTAMRPGGSPSPFGGPMGGGMRR